MKPTDVAPPVAHLAAAISLDRYPRHSRPFPLVQESTTTQFRVVPKARFEVAQ